MESATIASPSISTARSRPVSAIEFLVGAAHYDAKCQACHGVSQKTCPVAKQGCTDCHMPKLDGYAADFVFLDKAQHSAGRDLLDSVRLGDLPGIGMTIIDGIVRTERSRNTPPAIVVPEIVRR